MKSGALFKPAQLAERAQHRLTPTTIRFFKTIFQAKSFYAWF
jgi:hypothetical protein